MLPAHAAASPEPTSPAESASKLGAVARVSETGADVEQIEAAGLLQFFSLAPDPYCQGGGMILTASAKCGPRLAPPSKKREKSQAQKRRYHSAAFKLEVVREAPRRAPSCEAASFPPPTADPPARAGYAAAGVLTHQADVPQSPRGRGDAPSTRRRPPCRTSANHANCPCPSPAPQACQLRKWIQQRERIERMAAASGAA